MTVLKNSSTRRDALKTAVLSLGGSIVSPAALNDSIQDDEKLIEHEMKAIGLIDEGQYKSLWANLEGITDEELNWKIHAEANTIRWIIGHLTWFEEWVPDALEEKGMYLDSSQGPQSFEDASFAYMKERFKKARDKYVELTSQLKPEQLKKIIRFVPNKLGERYELSLHSLLLSVHPTHLAGHRYQVRFIRGTYSRYARTDKTKFDEF